MSRVSKVKPEAVQAAVSSQAAQAPAPVGLGQVTVRERDREVGRVELVAQAAAKALAPEVLAPARAALGQATGRERDREADRAELVVQAAQAPALERPEALRARLVVQAAQALGRERRAPDRGAAMERARPTLVAPAFPLAVAPEAAAALRRP